MKQIAVACLCLLLCAALLCGCDGQTGGDVSVDINAPVHVLDDFKNGDISCLVTVQRGSDTSETSVYELSGQQAVDLYNLLNRANWVEAAKAETPTGAYTQMMTVDFYAGRSFEKATAFFGTFSLSNQERVIASASPSDLSLSMAQAPAGTYEAMRAYVVENGEESE